MASCKRIAAYRLITSLRDRLPTGTETEIYEEIVCGKMNKRRRLRQRRNSTFASASVFASAIIFILLNQPVYLLHPPQHFHPKKIIFLFRLWSCMFRKVHHYRYVGFPRLVLPVPGGPTKSRIEPCFSCFNFITARCWIILSLTFSSPL